MTERLPSTITVTLGRRTTTVRLPAPRRVEVVTAGRQGPVGTLSAEQLQRMDKAIADADSATQAAGVAVASVEMLIGDLTTAFSFYDGAIAAQTGSHT